MNEAVDVGLINRVGDLDEEAKDVAEIAAFGSLVVLQRRDTRDPMASYYTTKPDVEVN